MLKGRPPVVTPTYKFLLFESISNEGWQVLTQHQDADGAVILYAMETLAGKTLRVDIPTPVFKWAKNFNVSIMNHVKRFVPHREKCRYFPTDAMILIWTNDPNWTKRREVRFSMAQGEFEEVPAFWDGLLPILKRKRRA